MLQVSAESPPHSHAQKIHSTSDQMLQIIIDLLESTTIDSGNLTLNLQRADLAALAALVVERNRSQAERKQQTLHFSADAALCLRC